MAMIPFVHTSNPDKNSKTNTSKGSTTKNNGATTTTVGSGMIGSTEKWRGAEADVSIEQQDKLERQKKEEANKQKEAGKMLWRNKWVDKPENFDEPLKNDDMPEKIDKILEKQEGNGYYYNYDDPKTGQTLTLKYLEPTHYVPLNYPESTTPTLKCQESSFAMTIPEDIYRNGKYVFLINVKRTSKNDKIADENVYILNIETKEMHVIPARSLVVREDGNVMDVYKYTLFRGHKVFSYSSLEEIKGLADDPDNVM